MSSGVSSCRASTVRLIVVLLVSLAMAIQPGCGGGDQRPFRDDSRDPAGAISLVRAKPSEKAALTPMLAAEFRQEAKLVL